MESFQEDEAILATVNMYKFEVACQQVLDHICYLEVINPLELRNYAKEEIKNRYTIYHN